MSKRNQENLYTLMQEEEIDVRNIKGIYAYDEEQMKKRMSWMCQILLL